MRKNLPLQAKIILSFSMLSAFIISTFLVFFDRYVGRDIESMLTENAVQLAIKVSQRLDSYVKDMDQVAKSIATNSDTLRILTEIAARKSTSSDYDRLLYVRTLNEIVSNLLASTSIQPSCVFVRDARGLYEYQYIERESNFDEVMKIPALAASLLDRKRVLFVSKTGPTAFSLLRSVYGLDGVHYGYVEILEELAELDAICDVGASGAVEIVGPKGEAFYPARMALPAIPQDKDSGFFPDASGALYSFARSDATGYRILIKSRTQAVMEPLRALRNATFLTILALALFSLVMIYIISRRLVHPIRALRDRVVKVSLGNMRLAPEIPASDDEVRLLESAFQDMLRRLEATMEREIALTREQEQSRFEALQARMAPHFIHNTLYIIGILAQEKRTDDVVRMCKELSNMLRYVVASPSRGTTMGEEVAHAGDYLSLQRSNYEDGLEYTIDLEESVRDVALPRLVIQPFIENSIHSGFKGHKQPWEIDVRCRLDGERWRIEIDDNGRGFEEHELRVIQEAMADGPSNISREALGTEDGMAGIGILNTYFRLRLMYKDSLEFRIGASPLGGARISIAGSMDGERGECYGREGTRQALCDDGSRGQQADFEEHRRASEGDR
jgi:two-component system sensor histidine kinase YesM